MGACVALIRLMCIFVGGSLAVLYVTGYAHGRPVLTPQTNNGRLARNPANPFDAFGTSTRVACNAAGECAAAASDVAKPVSSLSSTTADEVVSDRHTPRCDADNIPTKEEKEEKEEAMCRWWTPETGRETDTLCSAFALRRLMGSDALARALERAKQCATLHGTACVLSHEVELQVPAVMLWDSTTSAMRMYLLPRVVVPVTEGGVHEQRRVAVVRPPFDNDVAHSRAPLIVLMNRSVEVDHVSTTSHARESEQLIDDDAYCMQMLKLTIPDRCNEEL